MKVVKILSLLFIVLFGIGWLLFRPSTDEIHPRDGRIGTILTFPTPMVYVTNCSQCSFSSKAQDINTFLMPQSVLYSTTGFLDKNSIVSQVNNGEQFTITEVFTNHPHGLESAFREETTYLVVEDSEGRIASVDDNVDEIIEFESNSNSRETKRNNRLLDDVAGLDIFWVAVRLHPHMFGEWSDNSLPDDVSARKTMVANIEHEFLNKFPKDQILNIKLDPFHPVVYLQMDRTDALLYLQSEQTALNIDSISLYVGENEPSF